RHEWWNPPPSGGGKAHDEAGAEHPRRLAAHAIFNADRATVRFDDLLGDRQAKPGILTEALFRPVGIETLEDFIERFRPDTRALVVDQNFDLAADPAAGDTHGAARGGERARIIDQVADDLADPGVVARDLELGQRALE